MIKDQSHMDQVERWVRFVRENKNWKKIHTEFINAQFAMSEDFLKRLAKEKGGKEKIIKLFGIKNLKGYLSLQD